MPNEYLEFLFGTCTPDLIEVQLIVPVKITVASDEEISYSECDATKVKRRMAPAGLSWLGTIHSHPNAEASPSLTDIFESFTKQEKVFGILSIYKRPQRHRFHTTWWLVDSLHRAIRL